MSATKISLHVPVEQYGFVGMEYETEGDIKYAEAAREYKLIQEAFKEKTGLPSKDFDQFIQAILEEQPNHIEQLEQLNEQQNWAMQVIKRAMARIAYKERKELPPILRDNE